MASALAGITGGVQASAGIMSLLLGIYPPLLEAYQQFANNLTPNRLPDLGSAVAMKFREEISESEMTDIFKKTGIKPGYAESILRMSEQMLTIREYITLWRRGELTEDGLDIKLKRLRLSDADISSVKKVSEFFPAPADLITFAVREVYTPETVSKFGQMEDIPKKFLEEAAKAGVSKEQAENYWASHWNLPSPRQGFEMRHRGAIKEEDLDLLLKSLDVMPFWREGLKAISYNLVTRVDARRMYRVGTWDAEQVEAHFKRLGYTEQDAKDLTDFTIKYESNETSGLSRANIVTAFKKGIIDRPDLQELLKTFGYSQVVYDFWLDMADYEKAYEEIQSDISELVNQYMKGMKTIGQVRDELNQKDLPATFVDKVVDDTAALKSQKVKMPTKSDLENWLLLAVIEEQEYSQMMINLGYQDVDVQRYLTQFSLEKPRTKRKFLPIKTYQGWLGKGIMTEEQFVDTATLMKIKEDDILNLVGEVKGKEDELEG